MDIARLAAISISVILINNIVLTRFLGLCPYLGISRRLPTAVGMSLAVIFVLTGASVITWPIYNFVLLPRGLEFLNIVSFILVIASFVQFVEITLKKFNPALHRALGIYLPLITTNCAVLYVVLLNTQVQALSFLESVVQGFSTGIGYAVALILLTTIRERLEMTDAPEFFKGVPLAFITVGLLSLAFLGFSGLITH